MIARRLLPLVLVLATACGGGDTTEPPSPATLVATSANPVAGGQVATAVGTMPSFEVRSASGTVLSGVPVTVTVTQGGGSVAGAPTASLAGPTPIGIWTLGTTAGAQAVTVSVPGTSVAPLVFLSVATPGAASSLLLLEGDNQVVSLNATVPQPIRVRVRDVYGNGVAGAAVTWTVDEGGGNLATGTSNSDAQGIATAPQWTLGAAGEQAILATLGAAEVRIVALQTAFNVEIRYVGGAPAAHIQAAFANSVQRIRKVITGDLTDIAINNLDISCMSVGPVTETIDDVVIYAKVEAIDGAGGTLGSAGPCGYRNSSLMPFSGGMRFDVADLENLFAAGRLENVILHEMLHVIGVGTFWSLKGLLADANTANVRFTGALARTACINDNGGAVPCNVAVPAENCLDLQPGQSCGAGTINSHWKESIFDSELMTGYLGSGVQPLSAMTVQSLADMGYVVNLGFAEAYTVPAPGGLQALFELGAPATRMPAPSLPRIAVDERGRVVRNH